MGYKEIEGMPVQAKVVLSITLSLLAVFAVLACPLWVAAAQSTHHHNCCHKSTPASDRCPMTICEVSAPYLTEGKFELASAPMIVPSMDALAVAPDPDLKLQVQHPEELAPLAVSPPNLPILLHVILI